MTQPPPTPKAIVTEIANDFLQARLALDVSDYQIKCVAEEIGEAVAKRLAPNPDASEIMREALDELQGAEWSYRYFHDTLGSGHSKTGRAWDLMKRAGDKAREALSSISGGEK